MHETKVCSRANCPHGGEPQPLANFVRDRSRKDGLRYECKTCHSADLRAKYARDTERERQRVDRIRKQRIPEGVQRNTLYVRNYRARQRAEREGQ